MKIYFIGIAGAGMHSLANYLYGAGHTICGSDPGADKNTLDFWKKRGTHIHLVQKSENIYDADLVVYSAAVPASNPERQQAEKLHIACSRGAALARFANEHRTSIAICGTHGKGTTAAAVVKVLADAGLVVSDILGAVPIGDDQPSHFNENANYLVCEVDESDKTNLLHLPAILLINNVEEDHLNIYHNLEGIVACFEQHVRACIEHHTHVYIHYAGLGAPLLYERLKDCPEVEWIAQEGVMDKPCIAYHIEEPDDNGCCPMTIREAGGDIYRFVPKLGGRANAQNLASCIAITRGIDISAHSVVKSLQNYMGLYDRCQLQYINNYILVTDYASHPTCVMNDIEWVKTYAKRMLAIYHPYRYSLMQCHWSALARNLSQADIVLLAPFDGAGEPPVDGLTSEDLAILIKQNHIQCDAKAFLTFDALEKAAKLMIQPGDALIIFGGGPLFDMGKRIVDGSSVE